MHPAPEIVNDHTQASEGSDRRTPRYTPGLSDGLGERVLLFDADTSSSLELLRFRKEFSDTPGFEAALRKSAEQVAHLHHPSFSSIRSVERLGPREGVALVSHQILGRRLSEILVKAKGPVFAFELIRKIAPALAALHEAVPPVAHGVLTPERIAVTREGRLVILEQVVGAAIAVLRMPARKLRSELGIAILPADGSAEISCRTDVIQLGLMALSLLLGRRVDPADYPADMAALLDEAVADDPASKRLRPWLEQALQLNVPAFANAQEALAAFQELPEEQPESSQQIALLSLRSPARPFAASSIDAGSGGGESSQPRASVVDLHSEAPRVAEPQPRRQPERTREKTDHGSKVPSEGKAAASRWTTFGLIGLSVAEAAVILFLIYARSAGNISTVVVASPLAQPQAPPAVSVDALLAVLPAALPASAAAHATDAAPIADKPAVDRAVASGPRFGGITVSSPLELQVFEGGSLLGSTSGPIAVSEGTHTIEIMNEALGFRTQQTVEVKAGQMAAITVTPPNGRLSVNAVPWANVSIDGRAAGETPLANLVVPIGYHEIVFRHPQFGEQRQTVTVKTQDLTRVSVSMQR